MPRYTLYSYFRSSASYRVRIAMGLKGLDYDYVPVHLLEDGGQQYGEAYKALNPMSELPCLVVESEGQAAVALAQSVAILEYLEETHPVPPLLPSDPVARARVRQLVEVVNSSIQPIQNLKVMRRLTARFGTERDQNIAWARYWIDRGFEGLEVLLGRVAGRYAFGDQPTLADVVLVPQVYNARRFGVDMTRFPVIDRVASSAEALEGFQAAGPATQPDAPAPAHP
jgi:maleylacetoacetate isomerase